MYRDRSLAWLFSSYEDRVRPGTPEHFPGRDCDASDVSVIYPRPTNGMLLAITVMFSTLADNGSPAM